MKQYILAAALALCALPAHAYSVYQGCTVPVANPSAHTWYVDPVHGDTPANGADGSQAKPWNSLTGIVGSVWGGGQGPTPTGYTRPLLSSIVYAHSGGGGVVADNVGNPPVQPGDTILLESGTYGGINIGVFQHEITNSDFVTIKADVGAVPVFTEIELESANKFIFDGIKVQSLNATPTTISNSLVIVVDQGTGLPTTDIVFNNLDISSMDSIAGLTQSDLGTQLRNVGMRIVGAAGNGTNGQPGVTCISATNNKIHNTTTGAVLFGNNTLFDNNQITYIGGDFIEYAANNLAITHNSLTNNFALSTGIHQDAMQGQIGQAVAGVPYNVYSNILIDSNYIANNTDPNNPYPTYLQGIDAFDASWEHMTITNNVILASSCWGISMGSIHDSLIANNTVMEDFLTPSPGCFLTIGVGGGTHEGPGSANVRVVNNIAPHYLINDQNQTGITYDHNVALSDYQPFVHWNPLSSQWTYSIPLGVDANGNRSPTLAEIAAANSGITNFMDLTKQFTTWSPSTRMFNMIPLAPTSFALGAGTMDSTLPAVDLQGYARTAPFTAGALIIPPAGAIPRKCACTPTQPAPPPSVGPTDTIVTPLHTYYLAPGGSDSNNGLTPATAWLTPNHSVVCGDVIIAAGGSYTTQFQGNWGTVSSCPSTKGGIDGQGGVNFASLVCAGPDLTSCPVHPGSGNGFDVVKSNWAVEGFDVSVGTAAQALLADACSVTSTLHHVAFINDVVHGAGYGVNATPCGNSFGVDYFGVVGNIVQNANAWSGTCSFRGAALDINSPQTLDTNAGTHIFVNGNFLAANIGPPCGGSDYEAIMADTWGGFSYAQQGVYSNNLVYDTAGYGMQVFGAGAATLKIYNNTFYDSSVNIPVPGEFNSSEINLVPGSSGPSLIVQNNIARTSAATAAGGTPVYAINMDSVTTSTSPQPVVSSNTLFSLSTSCEGVCQPTSGGAGNMVAAISCCTSPEYVYGTNNYTDPLFANLSDLLSKWVGAPNCAGDLATDACMAGAIADLVPHGAGTAGQGYQAANAVCAPNADYPSWLKGEVYLHWTGSVLVQKVGLVTKPCGL